VYLKGIPNLFDFEVNSAEEIKYWEYDNKEANSLYRVGYDETFRESFYKNSILSN